MVANSCNLSSHPCTILVLEDEAPSEAVQLALRSSATFLFHAGIVKLWHRVIGKGKPATLLVFI